MFGTLTVTVSGCPLTVRVSAVYVVVRVGRATGVAPMGPTTVPGSTYIDVSEDGEMR